MKRCWMSLLIVVLLLSGCAPAESDGNITTLPEEELYLTEPKDPVSDIVEYDPERTLYVALSERAEAVFSGENGWQTTIFCHIISKEPVDLDSIAVHNSLARECLVTDAKQLSIRRDTEYTAETETGQVFPYYLYQVYRGVDFTDEEAQDDVLEDYKRLRAEHLPEFYAYSLMLKLTGDAVTTQTELTQIEMTVQGQSFLLDPGTIIIYPPEEDPYADVTWEQYLPLVTGVTNGVGHMQQPYHDGMAELPVMDVIFDRAVTITGAQVYCPGLEILDWKVQITSAKDDTMDYYWDGKTKIYIEAGDRLVMTLYFKNETLHQILLGGWQVNVKIDCTENGEYRYMVAQWRNSTTLNAYEEYAMIFWGLDMEPYYRDYYYQSNELWRKDYLQA